MSGYIAKSKTVEWATPEKLFKQLDEKFKFTLDPCCTAFNAKCKKFYTIEDNGLARSWEEEIVFMNPPYGPELGLWMQKAFREANEGFCIVVCLVPARTDTKWWHQYAMRGEIRFIKGRLKFGGHRGSAPFPSAIVVFDGMKQLTAEYQSYEAYNEEEIF
jgi:site-specific DNA-methyltransferase (adenine-specific)